MSEEQNISQQDSERAALAGGRAVEEQVAVEGAEQAGAATATSASGLSESEVRAAWAAEKCAACGGMKASGRAFCPTCTAALTIWQRAGVGKIPAALAGLAGSSGGAVEEQAAAGATAREFFVNFHACLKHLQLNPVRRVKLPARPGSSWRYETADELEAAGFRFIGHFACRVPSCRAEITLYWTPVTKVKMAVNFQDLRPHRESCKDPDYWRRRKEEKRAQASARRKERRRRKGRKA